MEPQPAAILGRLNEFLTQRPGDSLCTVLCAQVRGDHVVLSSAGHPPALIVSSGGRVREAPTSGPLLGAFADSTWPEEVLAVDRDLILMYTDGVTETVGRHERFGSARLRSLLSEYAEASPAELLAGLDEAVQDFSATALRDDVAALALRRSARASG
jgi:phosphoserine phosphatase RsbU/P